MDSVLRKPSVSLGWCLGVLAVVILSQHIAADYQGVECRGRICGFGTVCTITGCHCVTGYGRNSIVRENGTHVQYCMKTCTLSGAPCPVNYTCQDWVGQVHCYCATGATRYQGKCLDVDECVSQPCGQNAVCINIPGSFNCSCKPGYGRPETEPRTANCTDIDECARSPGICGDNSECRNTVGNYTCHCMEGYAPSALTQGDCIPQGQVGVTTGVVIGFGLTSVLLGSAVLGYRDVEGIQPDNDDIIQNA